MQELHGEFLNEEKSGKIAGWARRLYRRYQWKWLFRLGWKRLIAGERIELGDVVYKGDDGKMYKSVPPSYPAIGQFFNMDGMSISDDGSIVIKSGVIEIGTIEHPLYLGVLIVDSDD